MLYHPVVNIDIEKSYCISENEKKRTRRVPIEKKIKDLAEDKTNWSGKVLDFIADTIEKKKLRLPSDILIKFFSASKTVTNFMLEHNKMDYSRSDLAKIVRKRINEANIENDPDTVADSREVYLGINPKHNELDDTHMAELLILLSEIARKAEDLWLSVNLEIAEMKGAIFYFSPGNGHVSLSARSFNRNRGNAPEFVGKYIERINEIVDGKVDIPR